MLWLRQFSHNVHNAPELSPVFGQHELAQCLTCAQTRFGQLGYGGGLQGSVYAEMSRDKYQDRKTCIGSLTVSQRDGLPGMQHLSVLSPSPFCLAFLSSVRSAFPRFPAAACAGARKYDRLMRENSFGGATSSHPPNTFFVWFRSSPLDISRHTSCRSISLPIPKELEGLNDARSRSAGSEIFVVLSSLSPTLSMCGTTILRVAKRIIIEHVP